jgi:hypothetical protein
MSAFIRGTGEGIMRRPLFVLVVSSIIAAGLIAPARAAVTVAPGDFVGTADGTGCSLNFAYRAAGKTYIGTAAHCFAGGAEVQDINGAAFGRVVVEGTDEEVPSNEADDWALIEPYPGVTVDPRVRGMTNTPTGVQPHTQTSLGDIVRWSGHGIPFFVSNVTREQRRGVLNYQDADIFEFSGPETYGDSGGAAIHQATGRALGITTTLFGIFSGPTIEGVLAKATAKMGTAVTLVTV